MSNLELPDIGLLAKPSMEQNRMRQSGLTIIQLMIILLIAGILGSFIVDLLIEQRCERAPDKELCHKK
jgi:Tfp pilus assembly protein PilW